MLQIDHLTKHYKGSAKGVTDLTLRVEKGDLYAFIGHNGAGKTTTLKCITGIHGFDAGDITVGGVDVRKDPIACKKLVMPNTPPVTAPPRGPSAIAATATGIIFNVTASGPMFRYPRGVKENTSSTAVRSPSSVSCPDFSLVFIFNSSLLSFSHPGGDTTQGYCITSR